MFYYRINKHFNYKTELEVNFITFDRASLAMLS